MGCPRAHALKSETHLGSFSNVFIAVVPKGSGDFFHTVLTCGQGSWWEGPSVDCSCSVLTFGEGNGTPLQYSCLENPMDGGAWWAAVHVVAKSRTQLSDFTFTFHFHALEKEMATHSSVLAWRIPGMGQPSRLPSMGLHRVEHDWSDLAAAAAVFTFHWSFMAFFSPLPICPCVNRWSSSWTCSVSSLTGQELETHCS